MAFVAICPSCEHVETRPLADFEPLCPECGAGWLGDVRTDPPIAPDGETLGNVDRVLTALIDAVGSLAPEEAFTLAGELEEVTEEMSPAEQKMRLAFVDVLRERSRGPARRPTMPIDVHLFTNPGVRPSRTGRHRPAARDHHHRATAARRYALLLV
jgi:hypothetical protein